MSWPEAAGRMALPALGQWEAGGGMAGISAVPDARGTVVVGDVPAGTGPDLPECLGFMHVSSRPSLAPCVSFSVLGTGGSQVPFCDFRLRLQERRERSVFSSLSSPGGRGMY